MKTPYKMKGSPMQRNFGIGKAPMKDKPMTNIDRAVADMQYKKDSAGETFDADAYRIVLEKAAAGNRDKATE